MSKITKRTKASPPASVSRRTAKTSPARKSVKKRTNLTLDAEAVAAGEQYSERYGTNLSQLVNGFLHGLRKLSSSEDAGRAGVALSPAVRRLYGVAAGGSTDREAHREHLMKKYGSQG